MANQDEIQFHYDQGNEFFKIFLDKNYMMYSCGVWDDAKTLEDAQIAKLKRITDFAKVKQNSRVLDIGCGWGGMLRYCDEIKKTSLAHGLTLSQKQHDHVKQKINKNITVELSSWGDFKSAEKFDAILSVGAMEHFASLECRKKGLHINVYRDFFRLCFDASKSQSFLGLQTIATLKRPNTRQSVRDIRYLLTNVFPGSALPEINDIYEAAEGFYEIVEMKTISLDYVKTLMEWKKRIIANEERVVKNYGKDLFDHYIYYFDAASRGFEDGYTTLAQFSLKKSS